jgi:hypothetical protein
VGYPLGAGGQIYNADRGGDSAQDEKKQGEEKYEADLLPRGHFLLAEPREAPVGLSAMKKTCSSDITTGPLTLLTGLQRRISPRSRTAHRDTVYFLPGQRR